MMWDAVVVGAGPAGCSAASWLVQLGLRTALVEQAGQVCATLEQLDFAQDWLLGAEGRTLRQIGQDISTHLGRLSGLAQCLGVVPSAAQYQPDGSWTLQLSDGTALATRSLVLATGAQPRRPPAYFAAPQLASGRVLDAIDLTRRRHALPPGPVLLLGGGDNAVENALYLHERGHAVTLWARAALRAQPGLMQKLAACPAITLRTATPPPHLLQADDDGVLLGSAHHGQERYAAMAVLYGFEPRIDAYRLILDALRAAGFGEAASGVDTRQGLADLASVGVFIAGDASARMHPCVQTALADGVVAAKRVQRHVGRPPDREQARTALLAEKSPSRHGQVLRLTGLRFDAPLGWLEREKHEPQPIKVDAELNLGLQPLLPDDDDLEHVLDYRKVRQIIIDECNLAHTHLIETLLGKLCLRLSALPGVIGVRVQVTKLEIFDDCHVAMQAEVGVW